MGRNNKIGAGGAAATHADDVTLVSRTTGEALGTPDNPMSVASDGVDDSATTTASVTSATTVVSLTTAGFSGGSFQVTAIGTGNTVTFEASNNNTDWTAFETFGENGAQGTSGAVRILTTSTGLYRFAAQFAYVRARVSTYGSGTVTISGTLKRGGVAPITTSFPSSSQTYSQGASTLAVLAFEAKHDGSNYQRDAFTQSSSRIPSAAATTNATSAKASAGFLHAVSGYNAAAAVRYLKLYNKASAPTVGTDTPVLTIALAPSAAFRAEWAKGRYFSTGIAYALTTGAADADTGALTLADVVGLNVEYA